MNRLQDMYGDDFHPILKMSENAVRMQDLIKDIPPEEINQMFIGLKSAVDAWEKVAQYTEPKLKAVEVTGKDGEDLIPKSITVKYE